jgi:hypothetical protein
VFANFTIDAAESISPTFDGIVITGQHHSNPADTAAADQALSQQATQALGVAVKVETAPIATPLAATRPDDSAPFNAGAFMKFTKRSDGKTGYCSTGFGLRIGDSTYTTVARHCDGYVFQASNSTNTILRTYSSKQLSSDGAARLLTASGSKLMFYGDISSGLRATVMGTANVAPGDYVCTSGANSGTHCGGGANQKVRTNSIMKDDGFGYTSMLIADRVDGGVAAVGGDSGGPVYQNRLATQVWAVGMLQVGVGPVPCGQVRVATNCYKTIYYTSINTIIRGVPGSSIVRN